MLEATINYLSPMDEKPTYFLEPPGGNAGGEHGLRTRLTMPIRDARLSQPPASIEREGLGLSVIRQR